MRVRARGCGCACARARVSARACGRVLACVRRAVKGTWGNDGKCGWKRIHKRGKIDGNMMEGVWNMDVCMCAVRTCVYVNVVVAAACLAVLARAVKLSVSMLPRPVVRQQRKSGYASWGSMSPLGN